MEVRKKVISANHFSFLALIILNGKKGRFSNSLKLRSLAASMVIVVPSRLERARTYILSLLPLGEKVAEGRMRGTIKVGR